ncbi:sulfatase family protein [Membranihabitans marinus]|uniref:sulfatase family protein n=1 Tax=Membranihabitans marinus TaxID=1227546 RepID=UPI001F34CCBE|nr:sulfatase [Membranihabitans marinus]
MIALQRLILSLASIYLAMACQPTTKTHSPPNIIVFIADDVGWNDLSPYGNTEVKTPIIQRLASQGLVFDNAYLTASSCSPSRISIMTGRYPHNTGAAELHTEPLVELATIASTLKKANYYTASAGKWHMGELIKPHFDTIHVKGNGNGGEDKWLETLDNRPKDQPFFFWFAALDAHRPWGKNDLSNTHSFKDLTVPATLNNDDSTKMDLAKYYDEIARFDRCIGEIESALQESGDLNNTIFIIMADNGRPFPRDKTRVYDSGMKTPFIVYWPGNNEVKPGRVSGLVSSIDLAPTLAALAKVDAPASFQGIDFSPLLQDHQKEIRPYVFSEHNWHDHEAYERMIRSNQYLYLINKLPELPNQGPADALNSPSFRALARNKAQLSPAQSDIFVTPRPTVELFDVIEDPLQLNNLALQPSFQSVRDDLHQKLVEWQKYTDDTEPENLTKDWYHRDSNKKVDQGFNIRGEMPGMKNNAVHSMSNDSILFTRFIEH